MGSVIITGELSDGLDVCIRANAASVSGNCGGVAGVLVGTQDCYNSSIQKVKVIDGNIIHYRATHN